MSLNAKAPNPAPRQHAEVEEVGSPGWFARAKARVAGWRKRVVARWRAAKAKVRRFVAAVLRWLWDERANLLGDFHVYGGALVLSAGLATFNPGYGWIAFGAFMAWLGLRR